MRKVSRREFIAGAAAGGVTLAGGVVLPACSPGKSGSSSTSASSSSLVTTTTLRDQIRTIVDPSGTTLESTILRPAGDGYRRLDEGPGWPTVVRSDLAEPASDRIDRRAAIASIVHLTDIHLVDVQSPGRVEFLDRFGGALTAAFRAQESLTAQVGSSMVRRINALGGGPITGRAFDCAVSTGDNIDNQQRNEAEWFIRLLDGGLLSPNSGEEKLYEGVQDVAGFDSAYWHPDEGRPDDFKKLFGFPDQPGLMEQAIRPFETPALEVPWYSTYGNHDGLLQGNLPATEKINEILTLDRKVLDLKAGQSGADFIGTMFIDPMGMLRDLDAGAYAMREVTPDPLRRLLIGREWVQLHLDSAAKPGPVGHGYTEDHLELPAIYYDFSIAEGVAGISLDTGGYNSGSIGESQFTWLRESLEKRHSTYLDEAGSVVRTDHDDELVVIFSHYGPRAMDRGMKDPSDPGGRRILGEEVVTMLHRFPNVIAWVNGHHHSNSVTPVADPSGLGNGFWDINTASHIDFPQHARLIEIADNSDGTMSIFCTMIEHMAAARAPESPSGVVDLAALSRELAANDPQRRDSASGETTDRNVELVLKDPRRRRL